MNKQMILHAAIMIAGVFIASVAQVLLKKEAMIPHENRIKEYLNWRVILAYSMMLVSTLFTVRALRVIPVSMGSVLDSFGYIFITFFGCMTFRERITKERIAALILIISGIIVYGIAG